MIDFPAGSQHEITVERMDDRARTRVAVADKNSANGWKKPVQPEILRALLRHITHPIEEKL
jgi:hypothetical protein